MEKIVERGLLFDIYGELLTDRQKEVFGALVEGDMSMTELAEEFGISRQGAHDLIRRCDYILYGYEEKLKMMEKFLTMRGQIKEARNILAKDDFCEKCGEAAALDNILKGLEEQI